jgi:hypothetical protein
MTRVFELLPPDPGSTVDLTNWRLLEFEVDAEQRATLVNRQVIDRRYRAALVRAVAPLSTREDARRWLLEAWDRVVHSDDVDALKALAWLLKHVEEME